MRPEHDPNPESEMRHAQSNALLNYWKARRYRGAAPQRADIEPQDISDLLENIFMLRRVDATHHVFRLAGTGLCALYQREFRDQNFLSLWRGHDARHVQTLLESVLGGVSPGSLIAKASSLDMNHVSVEISFLPLRGPDGLVDRTLGLFQPLDPIDKFGRRPIVRTSVREIRPPAVQQHVFPNILAGADPSSRIIANDR
jgi:hypothetical protein